MKKMIQFLATLVPYAILAVFGYFTGGIDLVAWLGPAWCLGYIGRITYNTLE